MYAVVTNSPQMYMAYNNLDYLAMGSLNLLADAEQESFRNVSNAWVGGPNIPRTSKRSSLRQVLDSSNHPRDTTIESPETQRGKKESVGASSHTDEGSSIVDEIKIDSIGGFKLYQSIDRNTSDVNTSPILLQEISDVLSSRKTYTKPWGINIKSSFT